jgi:DNA-directed RNA polymerase subunit M/transcription elongation factor TFIIS
VNPGEANEPKTTRDKKCPECGSEKMTFLGGVGVASAERPPDPTRRLFQCQDCEKHFWYVGSIS